MNDENDRHPIGDRRNGGSGERTHHTATHLSDESPAAHRLEPKTPDTQASDGISLPNIKERIPSLNLSESVLDRIQEMDQDLERGSEPDQRDELSTDAPCRRGSQLYNQLFGFYPDSLLFSARLSVSFAVASLFLLAFPQESPWYESSWVYITVGVLSWNATIDSGTTLKKLIERTIGTVVGALLAFPVGFASLAIARGTPGTSGQAAFLGVALALHGFLFPYVADRLGYRSSYAAILGCMTFGIAVFPFYSDPKTTTAPWELSIWRVINILLGSVIAGVISFTLYPISTQTLVAQKVEELKKLTGKSTEMILVTAADSFSGSGRRPRPLQMVLMGTTSTEQQDDVHALYAKNMELWKSARALIPLLSFDPWFWICSSDEKRLFRQKMVLQIAQTFRIQLSAILLDSMVRSDLMYRQASDTAAGSDSLQLLRDIGAKISLIMDTSNDENRRAMTLKDLVEEDWRVLEIAIDALHSRKDSFSEPGAPTKRASLKGVSHLESELKDKAFLPLSTIDYKGEQSVFFLQMVQQLILRVAKLHFSQTAHSRPSPRARRR